MKKNLILLLVLLAVGVSGCARAFVSARTAETITPPLEFIPEKEKLTYQISWWGIPVSTATLESSERSKEGEMTLSFNSSSNWYLKALYPVRVKLTSVIDADTVSPKRFEAYVKRRWKVHQSVVVFDREAGTAFHSLPKGKTATVPVVPETQDGISLVYYARTLPFPLGKTIPFKVTADGKNWDLKGEIVQASVIRIGSLGKWPAIEGRLELAYPVPFFHGAKARVWFSADEERIPLLAKISSRIGPVSVVLIRRSVEASTD